MVTDPVLGVPVKKLSSLPPMATDAVVEVPVVISTSLPAALVLLHDRFGLEEES